MYLKRLLSNGPTYVPIYGSNNFHPRSREIVSGIIGVTAEEISYESIVIEVRSERSFVIDPIQPRE